MYGIQKDGDIQQIAGNSHIVADDALSTTSENPIQNKVVTNALADVVTAANEAETSTTTPRDADLLGGHAPSYFATTDSLSNLIKVSSATFSCSVNANNYLATSCDIPTLSGYSPIGIAQIEPYGSNYSHANILQASVSDKIYLKVGNTSSSNLTFNLKIYLIMLKN